MSTNISNTRLHATGLHPSSLSALVLDFVSASRLGLLGLAAAADVVAADCRRNHWALTEVKPAGPRDEQWMRLLESDESAELECKAAIAAFKSGGSMDDLCTRLLNVASRLSERTFPS